MTIKAIETHYDFYRFRSRLEARYAVFFNAMGIQYHYEPEGYHLGKAGPYLPDFFLPRVACWVEIKPALPSDEEKDKVQALADAQRQSAYLSVGLPSAHTLLSEEEKAVLHATPGQGKTDAMLWIPYAQAIAEWLGVDASWSVLQIYHLVGRIQQALRDGHGARFEHGEHPIHEASRQEVRPSAKAYAHAKEREHPGPVSPEYALLHMLCHNGSLLAQEQPQLSADEFHDADLRAIYGMLMPLVAKGIHIFFPRLLEEATNPRQTMLLTQMAMEPTLTNPIELSAALHDCITRIRQRTQKAMRNRIIEKLRTLPDGSYEQQRLVQEYNRLSKDLPLRNSLDTRKE